MMSPDLQRIKHMRDYCLEIQKTIQRYGDSFEQYMADADYQRSISFSIFQIGELSANLTPEFKKNTADRIQWGPMKAMRNLVVHNYGHVDHSIIWETAAVDIPVLLQFCNEQLADNA